MHTLWEISGSLFTQHNHESNARSEALIEAINTHGLSIRVSTNGHTRVESDLDSLIGTISGAETASAQHHLTAWLQNLRSTAKDITRAQFRHRMLEHVQSDNRSVNAKLRNTECRVLDMLGTIIGLVGREVKLPIRYHSVRAGSTLYGMSEEVQYSESETGNFHTLQTHGRAEQTNYYGMYVEDTPVSRRYLRYVDFLASRFGIRVLYCPKDFQHIEEICQPSLPTWTVVDDQVVRANHHDNFHLLFVALAFDRQMFESLLTVETEAQPGQTPARDSNVDYTPIFVDNLRAIVTVLTTLGSFAACKIYYKHYRTHARLSPADPS